MAAAHRAEGERPKRMPGLEAVSDHAIRFATAKQRRPLSPLWEKFIVGRLQPMDRLTLRLHEGGYLNLSPDGQEGILTRIRKQVDFHPFNLSDSAVNIQRSGHLLAYLQQRAQGRSTAWWPQDAASFAEALKKEREEIDAYGCIVSGGRGQQGGVAELIDRDISANKEAPLTKRQRTS